MKKYTFTAEPTINGSIVPATQKIEAGHTPTVTAVPDATYEVSGWTGDCGSSPYYGRVIASTPDGRSKQVKVNFAVGEYQGPDEPSADNAPPVFTQEQYSFTVV